LRDRPNASRHELQWAGSGAAAAGDQLPTAAACARGFGSQVSRSGYDGGTSTLSGAFSVWSAAPGVNQTVPAACEAARACQAGAAAGRGESRQDGTGL